MKDKSENTRKTYFSILNSFINRNNLQILSEYYFITNVDKVIDIINKDDKVDRKKSILDIIKLLVKNNKEVFDKYQNVYAEVKKILIERQEKNEPSEKEKLKLKYNLDHYRKKPIGNTYTLDELIFILIIHSNITLRNDYRTLKIYDEDNENTKEEENYININTGYLHLVKYKICKNYGEVVYKLEDDVINFIKKYIEKHNIKNGDYLIQNTKGEMYGSSKFTEKVGRVFNKFFKVRLSMDDVRKIKRNHMHQKEELFKDKNYGERKELYRIYFQHSEDTGAKYYDRLGDDLFNEEKENVNPNVPVVDIVEEKEDVNSVAPATDRELEISRNNLELSRNILDIMKQGRELGFSKEEMKDMIYMFKKL
jgi:hypothetical protein